MKILFIFFLCCFLLIVAIAIMMDLMMGMKFSMSLRNMKSPFWVMTIPEYYCVRLAIHVVRSTHCFFKQKNKRKRFLAL